MATLRLPKITSFYRTDFPDPEKGKNILEMFWLLPEICS